MAVVGIRELRQSLSRYLARVRLLPSHPSGSALARLVSERGATMPRAQLQELDAPDGQAASGPPSGLVLDDARQERS